MRCTYSTLKEYVIKNDIQVQNMAKKGPKQLKQQVLDKKWVTIVLGASKITDLADVFTGALSLLKDLPYQISWPYSFRKWVGHPKNTQEWPFFTVFLVPFKK